MEAILIISFSIFTLLSCFTVLSLGGIITELQDYQRIQLTSVLGPESLSFDSMGGGPYTGVSDGRILKWRRGRWSEFAVPSSRRNAEECNGSNITALEDKCGRPLGLQFHRATGDLYIADAYFGLLVVGSKGGVAIELASTAEGGPFHLTNGVDIDQENGMVYFTDSSTKFQRREYIWSIITGDATGRLMKYDPRTKQVTVLLRGLQFANGVAISKDKTFTLVAETTKRRILRYWLRGRRAGRSEVFAQVPGYPDNIKRSPEGDFWVALNSGSGNINLGMKYEVLQSPLMEDTLAVKLSKEGVVLEVLDDRTAANSVSEVEEHNGTLWLGSVVMPYVGVYKP